MASCRSDKVAAILVAIALITAQEAHASRLIRIQVYRIDADGTQTKILEDTRNDGGDSPPEEVWMYLEKARFDSTDTRNEFKLTRETKSKVRIFVHHGGNAVIDGLTLVPVNEERTIWRMADKDLQRATKVRTLLRPCGLDSRRRDGSHVKLAFCIPPDGSLGEKPTSFDPRLHAKGFALIELKRHTVAPSDSRGNVSTRGVPSTKAMARDEQSIEPTPTAQSN